VCSPCAAQRSQQRPSHFTVYSPARYRPDLLTTLYQPGIEFISKLDFPPYNPAPIFVIWLRFSEETD
jgi:hypothetical protein